MKKITRTAAALSLLISSGQITKAELISKQAENVVKEIGIKQEKRKKQTKQSVLEPFLPELNNTSYAAYTSPFFNPTRSIRVKNKLRRKWYK